MNNVIIIGKCVSTDEDDVSYCIARTKFEDDFVLLSPDSLGRIYCILISWYVSLSR